jgi:hypothetical protein
MSGMRSVTTANPWFTPAAAPRQAAAARPRVQVRVPFAVRALLVYLGAITIFGKGPTYLGIPPLFWGEMVMMLLLVWMWRKPQLLKATASRLPALSILMGLFLTLGAALTIKGFSTWKMDALRDAAIWYYGLFFFVGLYLSQHEALSQKFWRVLTSIWVAALVWGSFDLATKGYFSNLGPIMPWRGVSVFSNTGSELGQNVALGAVILMCAYTLPKCRSVAGRTVLALTGLGLFAASYGRGQKVGFALGVMVALALAFGRRRPPQFAWRVAGFLAACAVIALVVAPAAGIDLAKATQFDRFTDSDSRMDEGTAYWRMIWWQRLREVVLTEHPAFGLGFGLNLCVYNPYLEGTEDLQWVARSPHNFNMSIFSRMGLTGLALWGGILLLGIGGLAWRAWTGANRYGVYTPARREELMFWIIMLITTWINSSFGVLMEGPVLGIWFWFALGFANGRSLQTGQRCAF